MLTVVTWTVAVSVYAHGLTAGVEPEHAAAPAGRLQRRRAPRLRRHHQIDRQHADTRWRCWWYGPLARQQLLAPRPRS
jgi:hypothetical protein